MDQVVEFPRTRGDGPHLIEEREGKYKFPPHARGWTREGCEYLCFGWVSPARAGMDRSSVHFPEPLIRFPRTRGDGPASGPTYTRQSAFPPHARGWTRI